MTTFYSREELESLGIKKIGEDVSISRNAVIYHPQSLEIGNHVRIDDFTTVSGKVVIGNYVHFSQFCGLYGGDAGIYVGDFDGFASRVVIYAISDDYSGHSMVGPMVPGKYEATYAEKTVRLEKQVIIGCMSVILPGVTIGEGSSVGAMSLVTKPLDAWGMYAGIPARRLRDRSKKLLELEAQFLAETGETPPAGIN